MKLAMISPDGNAQCLICSWSWKVPTHRRNKGKGLKNLVMLTLEERTKLLEERILAHLKDGHDRIMIIREEAIQKGNELGMFQKTYYTGRSPYLRVK